MTVAIPKNVSIKNDLDQDLPQIMVDSSQLQQVVMNLIINAAEAMNGSPGEVIISTTQTELCPERIDKLNFTLMPPAPGPFVELTVEDNGVGMDEDTRKKIFDPFFTTKFTGRGLGLAAVLGIVRSHNGGVVVTSQPEGGTRFCIYFPVAANQEKHEAIKPVTRQQDSHVPKRSQVTIGQQNSVLLIDDDEMVRETIMDLFQLEDISVICAADGTEGIDLLEKHQEHVSLVLLDLSMPGISSEETFTQLRKIKSNLPVLLCSGFSQLKVNEFFASNDHQGFIAKPFDINHLTKKVREFL